MLTFREIAEPLANIGIPITPVRPGTKRAFLPDFPTTATTDLDQIYVWDQQFPNHNAACVARAEDGGVWFWEVDSPEVLTRIQKETGHDALSEIVTFKVRSRPGRGHFYFRHTEASKSLGNISQSYVIGQDWSVRTNREYVVAPGSIHPDTGEPYQALNWGTPIAEAPQWLLDWLLSQKVEKGSAPKGAGQPVAPDGVPRNASGRVPHGSIHGWMLTQAGKLRQQGLNQDELEPVLLRLVHENCEPPIDDTKVIAMAKSVCTNYEAGQDYSLVLNQAGASAPPQPQAPAEPEEEIDFTLDEHPLFPKWVMQGTSVYENFVKPYCVKNERIDYFMWVPTAAMLMNYVGTKVRVPLKSWKPSFYLVFIGEKNRAHKSSSIKDAMKFLEFGGMLQMYSKEIKNAEGRSVVWEAGSPEGLGTDMQRTNCKNAILFYDELSSLAAKSSIEGSGMCGALLKMYESANFSNSIKSKKDAFAVAPDSYVATLITATTDKRFPELWASFAGEDTGLNERFTFILQPKEMPSNQLEETMPFQEAALETRKLVDKAVNQGTYKFFDQTPFKEAQRLYGGRCELRAEKWALYFAIDLGLTEIDEDCVERGIAMAKYEHAVRRYLEVYETKTFEAKTQMMVMRTLKRFGDHGVMTYRELEKRCHAERIGTSSWSKFLTGLMALDYITIYGKGGKGDPKTVRMLRDMKSDDE